MARTRRDINFNSPGSRVFDLVNVVILIALGLATVVPFIFVIAGSFTSEAEITARKFFLWPHHATLEPYRFIFSTNTLFRSLIVTIGVTAVGTLVQLFMTFLMAYPLSRRALPGQRWLLNLIVFTMVFSGGMIPLFLVVRDLGLLNTYWALILPLAINPFYLIIVKNFFQEIPEELQEAARIDGASEMAVFWRIMLPLSKPILATFALFYAVAIWNDYMSPLLYISDSSKWTLQMFVRQVTVSTDVIQNLDPNYVPPAQGLKFAIIVVATLPILLFYPFLQKHFTKGMLIGSVKG